MSDKPPFSRVNVGAGGRLTVPQIRAYIRGLNKWLKDYPQAEEVAEPIKEEIEMWQKVVDAQKYVKPCEFKVAEN